MVDNDGNIGEGEVGGLIGYDGEKWTHYEIKTPSEPGKYLYEVKPYQMKYYEINH